MKERGISKYKFGQVIADKMDKTVVVEIVRKVQHPRFKKYYNKRSKFHAHDEKINAKVGDFVKIKETRPTSKLKRWKVVELVRKGFEEKISQGN